jgi:GNAT superfamily N-acetyltransferase
MSLQIIDMPDDDDLQQLVASKCVSYWKRDFPLDTDKWYLDLYAESLATSGLPVVLVAIDDGEFVGTASLIADDELPDALEPGPWVAAVYVTESHRGRGVGRALVSALQQRGSDLGVTEMYLYTEKGATWYQSMGWHERRVSSLSGHDVTVMSRVLQ